MPNFGCLKNDCGFYCSIFLVLVLTNKSIFKYLKSKRK